MRQMLPLQIRNRPKRLGDNENHADDHAGRDFETPWSVPFKVDVDDGTELGGSGIIIQGMINK